MAKKFSILFLDFNGMNELGDEVDVDGGFVFVFDFECRCCCSR